MALFVIMMVLVTLLKNCSSEMTVLEKFLTSGFNKDTTQTNQDEGKTSAATSEDLIKLMRRAGLIAGDNQIGSQKNVINRLQTLNPQQQSILYLPQQSQLSNYVAPKRQLQAPQQQQQPPLAQSSSRLVSDASTKAKSEGTSGSQQDKSSKTIVKADRQGLYAQDGKWYDSGYSGHNEGYVNAKDGYSDHQDSYSDGHYAPEPVAYHQQAYLPPPKAASVAIKIDPINILRLLLQGIPKPLLNLNGKLFFGVELGKNAGLVKGVGYAPPVHGGHYPPTKGIVLNLG